jgi:hypothetical protein
MRRKGDVWHAEFDLSPGEHYYKFLVNQAVRLNDPAVNFVVPQDRQGLWTPLFVEGDGLRAFDGGPPVCLEGCSFGAAMDVDPECRDFRANVDTHAVMRLGFSGIAGFQAVTALWRNPCGELHSVVENFLTEEDGGAGQTCYLWFWMDLNDPRRDYPEGRWSVDVLVNGRHVLEEGFTLSNELAGVLHRCDILA